MEHEENEPKFGSPEWYAWRTAGIARAGLCWGHLSSPDRRTPEERAAAETAEWARRRGKGRKKPRAPC